MKPSTRLTTSRRGRSGLLVSLLTMRHISGPGVHITCYVSSGDKALTLSQFLFGSVVRLGRLDVARLDKEQAAKEARLAYLVDFTEVEGAPGFIGHRYFTSDPAVNSDLVALIRYGLKPGEPGRPLEEIRRPFWRIPQ